MTNSTHSTTEKGHIKNLQNFDDLIQACTRFGDNYNPSATALTIPELETMYEDAKAKQDAVNLAFAELTHGINQRQNWFEQLPKITTRVLQSILANVNDKKLLADARTIAKKIHGKPSKPKTNDSQEGQETSTTTTKSNSQRSLDKLMEHLGNLIMLLENEPDYTPNEEDLSVLGLKNYLKELQTADKSVQKSEISYRKALTERDKVIYTKETGLIAMANRVKTYVRSIFGTKSLEYNEIRKFQFTRVSRI